MNKKRNLLRRYFLLTIALSWVFWLISMSINRGIINIGLNKEIFNYTAIFIPSIIGIYFVYLEKGKENLFSFLKKGLKYRFKFRYYTYFFIMPLVLSISYLISAQLFSINIELSLLKNPKIIPIVFIYILFLGGPLGEEYGWRGYVLPRLIKVFNPLQSSIILGIIWSIWHLPLFYMKDTVQYGLNFFGYLYFTVLITIIMTIIFIKTNGSILSAVLFHTMSNLAWGMFPLFSEVKAVLIALIILTLTTLFFIYFNKKIMV